VINYINKTSHFQLINGIVVGDKWFNSLPEEYQNIVLEEAKKAGENTARKVIKLADDYEDRMVEEGMKVIDSDTEAFKNAAQQAYEELEFVELKEKLYEEMNK
jgi:TRAP-type C4-dicarboxylate transport system substrate-binding protein